MTPRMVLPVGGLLPADVEGMGIYRGKTGSWLVVSSQGSDSYVVLDATAPFTVRGAFRIGIDAARGIDGTSERGRTWRGRSVCRTGARPGPAPFALPYDGERLTTTAWNSN